MVLFSRANLTGRGLELPGPDETLPGRDQQPFALPTAHDVLGTPMDGPVPAGHVEVIVGMGCFWGAERLFWTLDGVYTTAVGYAGGHTPHPTYEEVCSGRTGHTEVVRVVFDPLTLPYTDVLRHFWEGHDPTQGMRQGNDVGTQYRSALYVTGEAARSAAEASCHAYQQSLGDAGFGAVTTEVRELTGDGPHLYYAEPYHQQYLAKNPNGYCGIGGTGVACAVPSTDG